MEIIVVAILMVAIVLLKYIFKIDTKKVQPFKEDKELEQLTNKFPENVQIAEEMLEIIGNEKVKIEQAKSSQTSLYIAITNKISIADMKNNYARLLTIAHECMHSIQDRRLLLFNFIFSNINIIYTIAAIILTATKVIENTMLQIFILTIFASIKLAVRGYLEIDAMIKSKYLAKEYMEQKNIINKEQITSIITKYEEINKMAVPFTIVQILTSSILGILAYSIISLVL